VDCLTVDQRDIVGAYLAGGLGTAEAEAFEKHYFGCERCWDETRRTAEIRAALGKPALVALPEPGRQAPRALPSPRPWRWLAAAAVVVFAALGTWQLAHREAPEPTSPVLRGGTEASLPLRLKAGADHKIMLEWTEQPEAHVYVVEVFTSDGVSVWKQETAQTTLTLDPASLVGQRKSVSLLVRVEALGTMGQVVAKSELKPLPRP